MSLNAVFMECSVQVPRSRIGSQYLESETLFHIEGKNEISMYVVSTIYRHKLFFLPEIEIPEDPLHLPFRPRRSADVRLRYGRRDSVRRQVVP
ncbi:hypothetical protein CDAR_553491 [Caerostris darwini]|uniref:Ycf15 n=1 Tax=Caerostris darwini TaxID=1538125 RepID=A0AAV4T9V8_9ARAC|nr:hypothetical protein CDAR_553491 [Caerostris darwini]